MKHQTKITEALQDVKNFLLVKEKPSKDRQKLLRNSKLLDLLVEFLQSPYKGVPDHKHLMAVFIEIYEVLRIYSEGKSKKNSVYCARFIDVFTEHLSLAVRERN